MRAPARSLGCAVALVALLAGCYAGAGRPFSPASFASQPGWLSVEPPTSVHQDGAQDCGAAVAAMLLGYWGLPVTQADIRQSSGVPADHGLPARVLRDLLRARGLLAFLIEGSLDDLERELGSGRPVLVGLDKRYSDRVHPHYLLVVGFNRSRKQVVVFDPADGWRAYSFDGFTAEWAPTRQLAIVAFLASAPAPPIPEAATAKKENDQDDEKKSVHAALDCTRCAAPRGWCSPCTRSVKLQPGRKETPHVR